MNTTNIIIDSIESNNRNSNVGYALRQSGEVKDPFDKR